jgi:hypothetical protein
MKKYLCIAAVVIFIINLSSCVSYLPPSMTGNNNIEYLPRPFGADSAVSKSYVSAALCNSSSFDSQLNFNLGMVNFSRGHTFKHINLGYGAFAFLGNAGYRKGTTSSPLDNFNKFLYGWGLRATVGFQIVPNKGSFNFRLLNWENAFSIENGAYTNFRKDIYQTTSPNSSYSIYASNLSRLFTTGLSSEVIWGKAFNNDDLQIASRLFVGVTPRLNKSFKDLSSPELNLDLNNAAVNIGTFIKFKQLFGSVQIGVENSSGSKIALGYTF